ncbi:hypothetical protein MalM25_11300 [Planctomycetes bacterium MalM25]|nr:hypothetical protein MalM25_11300 [Planctomycetes bacterium MalM25]
MKTIQLVRLDPAIEQAVHEDPGFFEAMVEEDWPKLAGVVQRHVGHTLTAEPVSIDELAWGGYFVVQAETREVLGTCAFKGEPDESGAVEIAYLTFPEHEGQGYATAIASRLIALATESPAVRRVIAHTLPGKNASTRVLEKAGLAFTGEVVDPEDGAVWRWERAVGD